MKKGVSRFLRDNGLSLVLGALFLIFISGQTIAGWMHNNDERSEHGQAPLALSEYVTTGAYGEAVFENWESEFLQMGLYVILTAMLFQRGSAESRDPDAPEEGEPALWKDSPPVAKVGGVGQVLYHHSLSIAFLLLFLFSFSGHAIFGLSDYNDEALQHHQPTLTLAGYVGSSQFWFESLQNWQSEFLAILAIVLLSIWLREKGSPESKAVTAPHAQTGG